MLLLCCYESAAAAGGATSSCCRCAVCSWCARCVSCATTAAGGAGAASDAVGCAGCDTDRQQLMLALCLNEQNSSSRTDLVVCSVMVRQREGDCEGNGGNANTPHNNSQSQTASQSHKTTKPIHAISNFSCRRSAARIQQPAVCTPLHCASGLYLRGRLHTHHKHSKHIKRWSGLNLLLLCSCLLCLHSHCICEGHHPLNSLVHTLTRQLVAGSSCWHNNCSSISSSVSVSAVC